MSNKLWRRPRQPFWPFTSFFLLQASRCGTRRSTWPPTNSSQAASSRSWGSSCPPSSRRRSLAASLRSRAPPAGPPCATAPYVTLKDTLISWQNTLTHTHTPLSFNFYRLCPRTVTGTCRSVRRKEKNACFYSPAHCRKQTRCFCLVSSFPPSPVPSSLPSSHCRRLLTRNSAQLAHEFYLANHFFESLLRSFLKAVANCKNKKKKAETTTLKTAFFSSAMVSKLLLPTCKYKCILAG